MGWVLAGSSIKLLLRASAIKFNDGRCQPILNDGKFKPSELSRLLLKACIGGKKTGSVKPLYDIGLKENNA
jgi:hypothetical protein